MYHEHQVPQEHSSFLDDAEMKQPEKEVIWSLECQMLCICWTKKRTTAYKNMNCVDKVTIRTALKRIKLRPSLPFLRYVVKIDALKSLSVA